MSICQHKFYSIYVHTVEKGIGPVHRRIEVMEYSGPVHDASVHK